MNDVYLEQLIFASILLFAVGIGMFLLARWFMLWYWKVNRIVENQEEQIMTLKLIHHELQKLQDKQGSIG